MSALTSTMVIAGKCLPMTLRYACPISGNLDRYSRLSMMNQVSRDMRRRAARFPYDRDDVLEGLADLRDEVLAFELLFGIPADLAGDENEASRGDNPVGVAPGALPVLRMQEVEWRVLSAHSPGSALAVLAPGRSRKRWILPVCVFGSAPVNLMERGYL